MKQKITEKKLDGEYFKRLNILIDKLFDVAAAKQWTWEQMSEESGLARQTIYNLGARVTKYPQYRTVELLARSLGGTLIFHKASEVKRSKPQWTLKIFSGRRRTNATKAA